MDILNNRNIVRTWLWNWLGDEAYAGILHPLYDHIATELWDSLGDRLAYHLLLDQLEEDHVRYQRQFSKSHQRTHS